MTHASDASVLRVYEAVHSLGRPTVREIGAKAGLSSSATVWWCLEKLREQNLVTWDTGKMRTIRITDD